MNIRSFHALKISLHWVLIPSIAIAMSLWPTLSNGLEKLQPDPGDTILNIYFLEHAYRHFTTINIVDSTHFWSPNYFWPVKDTLAWSDHLLGQSIIYGFFRLIFDPFQSYLAWLLLTLWFNYVSVRFAIQKISPQTEQVWLSLIALVTTFSPTILQQLGHPQLLSLFLTGPILLLGNRLIREPVEDFSVSDWLILGSWLVANGFFNIYVFVYACFGSFICVLIHLFRRICSRSLLIFKGQHLWKNISIFSILTLLNFTIYIPYLETLKIFGRRPNDEILFNLPKPASWLFSSKQLLLPGPIQPETVKQSWIYGAEQELFPGWAFLILLSGSLITALISKNRASNGLKNWLWVISLMLIFSMSLHSISAWPIISKILPGASSLRASSRVGMMIILFTAPVFAIAAERWKISLRLPSKIAASFFAIGGGFSGIWALNLPSFSLADWKQEHTALSNAVTTSQCSAFWYQWSDQAPWRAHAIAMHTQLRTGIPTVNGYSGHFPKGDWPFTNPSGQNAFKWIKSNVAQKYHSTRLLTDESTWCIAALTDEGSAKIEDHDSFIASSIKSPAKYVFNSREATIGAKNGNLFLKDIEKENRWLLITRNGRPIASKRGKFKIVNAEILPEGNHYLILITDRNIAEGIEYIWRVNPKTGQLLGQVLKILPRP